VIVRKNSLNKIFLAATAITVAVAPTAESAPKSVPMKQFVEVTKEIGAEGMVVTSKAIITYSNIEGKSSDIFLRAVDFAGALIWSKTIDSGQDEVATAITADAKGTIWVGGNSSSAAQLETITAVAGALNPDSVTVETPIELRGDMKNISLWQLSPTGDLAPQLDLKITQPALVDAISTNATGVSILLSRESGQSLALVKDRIVNKEVKLGTAKSKFNVIFRAADGSTSLFGSSTETLAGKKLAGKVDGILMKVSKTGSISSVVRSSASGAMRDWQSATASNFITGVVRSGKKIETAVTKFNSTITPTCTTRILSTGVSLAASGANGSVFAIFEPTTALKGVTGWKQVKGQSVALQFDSKGFLIGAFTNPLLNAPITAGYSAEGGLILLTAAGDILRSTIR